MSLHKKTFLIIFITFMILLAILYVILEHLFLENFSGLEKEYTEQHLARALNAIEHENSVLDKLTLDWSAWDDTYRFVQDRNEHYINVNLLDKIFIEHNINLMIYTDASGRFIYGKYFDLENKKYIDEEDNFFKNILSDNRILTEHKDRDSKIEGLILLGEGPVIIDSRPVITSQFKGPIMGTLIMGCYLNERLIEKIGKDLHLSLDLYSINYPVMSGEATKLLYEKKNFIVQPLNEKTVCAYSFLKDIYGKPVLLLKVNVERKIYRQGKRSIIYILLYFLFTGLTVSFITLLLLDKLILSRLINLSYRMNVIGKTSNLSERIFINGYHDELTCLAKSINEMLQALEQSQEELNKAVINSMTARLAVLDRNGIITSVNEAWENFYRERDSSSGPVPSDIGKDYMLIWQRETEKLSRKKTGVLEGISRVVDGSLQCFSCEYEYKLNDRNIWFLLNVTPLAGKKGGTVISLVDITERKKAEEEILMIEKQLRQAQKLEAIGTLAGGIAHDFNNILASIIGFTEICLSSHCNGNTELRYDLGKILKAGCRARDLVKQILTFSRQSEQVKEIFDFKLIIKEVVKLLCATLPSTIEIIQKTDISSATMLGAPVQMHQILMNLGTNAAYAMRDRGGILEISLEKTDIKEKIHHGLEAGHYLHLTVKDTGTGIPYDIMDKIFDPFFTTKPYGEGTGLGLSTVHGIVKSHGGTIYTETWPGKGTEFHILIPSVAKETAKEDIKEPCPVSFTRGNILFVDDEEDIVCLVKKVMSYNGYAVTATSSSKEAFELFQLTPENFDLVITDYTMPYMRGTELAEKMLKIRPDIPVILCTGYNDSLPLEKINALGIKDMLFKPFTVASLEEMIQQALNYDRNISYHCSVR
ncbi:MAG: CHASE4 domain-containing protein [Candidatus Eremiobacterota bacterium]